MTIEPSSCTKGVYQSFCWPSYPHQRGRAIHKILEQGLDPTAVVTFHDIRAPGVMDTLKQAGVQVSEKIIGVFVVRAKRQTPNVSIVEAIRAKKPFLREHRKYDGDIPTPKSRYEWKQIGDSTKL